MKAKDVIDVYHGLEDKGIKIWIDGGWAVDALLGKQTREHKDLDIAVERKNLSKLKKYLEDLEFEGIQREEDRMWDLVMVDKTGREIEAHAFDLDSPGNIVTEDYWNGYSSDSLNGKGVIGNNEVKCVSLNQIVKTHNKSMRALKETDLLDMKTLSARFGVVFPE